MSVGQEDKDFTNAEKVKDFPKEDSTFSKSKASLSDLGPTKNENTSFSSGHTKKEKSNRVSVQKIKEDFMQKQKNIEKSHGEYIYLLSGKMPMRFTASLLRTTGTPAC